MLYCLSYRKTTVNLTNNGSNSTVQHGASNNKVIAFIPSESKKFSQVKSSNFNRSEWEFRMSVKDVPKQISKLVQIATLDLWQRKFAWFESDFCESCEFMPFLLM